MGKRALDIVMVGPFAFQPKGTVSARAFLIARALANCGHRVTILMPPYDHLADSGRSWEEDGVRLENMTIRRNDAWHQLAVPVRMAHRAIQLQPDVVHVFKPIGYSGLTGLYLSWLSRQPVVLDTDDWEGRGGWADVNPYPALWRLFFDRQERWLARRAGAVTVVSHTLQAQVWGLGVDPGRVVYLPNGPDARLRSQAQVSESDKMAVRARLGVGRAPFALYLGHIPHGTDLDLALHALPYLEPCLPEARLVIAGVGAGLEQLRAQAQAMALDDRVHFPGWIPHEQAHLYVATADAAVNPYRNTLINRSKCAGKVILAMGMGKPVVTSRLGQNLEYIEDGHSGILTDPGDARDLARGLFAVLSDPTWAAELGCQAKKRIWERFGWDARVGQVERAYGIARAGRKEP
jgi:glycosyltransferase involved in cell wall biosynthesis